MNLVDRYLAECMSNRNYNWCIQNLYINIDQPFIPTTGQQDILLTRDNIKAFLMPRGAGASTVICMDAIAQAMIHPVSEIVIFVPNQMAILNMKRRIKDILRFSSIDIKNSRDHILLNNQSIIRVITPNPVYYVGLRPNAIYIDNFDMINNEELSNIFSRLMHTAEKVLIIGNNVNSYETTTETVNINLNQI